MKKTILVTGAAGFIGSHLCETLLNRGDRVIGLDNLDGAYDPAHKQANLEAIAAAGGQWEFVLGDIRETASVERLFDQNAFDAVVHLAAMNGLASSIEDPVRHYDVNVLGTLNLLNAAKQHLVGNFVFASCSSVYGETPLLPYAEADRCDHPLAPYPASKRAAELLGYSFHHLYSQNFTALRFFTVYGPRSRPDSLAFRLADGIVRHKKVRLFCRGNMQRDWIYISDLVDGIAAAIDRPLGYEIINLGRGEPVLVAGFLERLECHAGAKAVLIPAILPDIDVPCAFASIDKARRLLDFQPAVPLDEGVQRFWEWYAGEELLFSSAN